MKRAKLTDVAYESLRHVLREHSAGRWARARRSGERASLAALDARGLVVRRAWRGTEGHADAAYEYQLSKAGIEHLRTHREEAARASLREQRINAKNPANTDVSGEQATPGTLHTGP